MSKIHLCVTETCKRYPAVVCSAPPGFAVDPDVWSRKSVSSAFIGSGSHVSLTSAQRVSATRRRASHGTGLPVRRKTTTCRTSGASAQAWSAFAFSGTVPPLRLAPRPVVITTVGARVPEPLCERVRGEAAEDDDVRRADPGSGEHGYRDLGNHPHVDPDGRPSSRRAGAGRWRVARLSRMQVGVRHVARVSPARLADPVVGDLRSSAGLDVAVEAAVRGVQLAVGEPGAVRRIQSRLFSGAWYQATNSRARRDQNAS